MCLARDYADIYPIEIRTRKATRRSLSDLATEPSRLTQTRDRGQYQRPSHSQPRISQARKVPRCHIIEPWREDRKGLAEGYPPARHSLPRSHSFHFDLPSIRRLTNRAEDHGLRSSRRRDRSPRPFAVDFPEVITRAPQTPRVSTSTQTCFDSRQDSDPDEFEDTESEDESDGSSSSSSRHPRASQPTRNPRPPRERTPVSDRKPMRPRQRLISSQPVEIHQSSNPVRDSDGERNIRRRQVHFAEGVEYVQNTSRSRGGSMARRLGGRRCTSSDHSNQETSHVRVGNRRDSFNRRPSLRVRSPSFGELRGAERPFATSSHTRQVPPRVIQDGRRQISEAAVRLYAEARTRRSCTDLGHRLRSYTIRYPRSRRSGHLGESRFGDLRTSFDDTGPYRTGRHWRWR